MQRLLVTVADTRAIKGRGTCIFPFLTHDQMPDPRWWRHVKIECPDGKNRYGRLRGELIYDPTSPEQFYYASFIKEVLPTDIPAGAKIWVLDDGEYHLLIGVLCIMVIAFLMGYNAVKTDSLSLPVGFVLFAMLSALLAVLHGRLVYLLPWKQAVRRALVVIVLTPVALGFGGVLAHWWFG